MGGHGIIGGSSNLLALKHTFPICWADVFLLYVPAYLHMSMCCFFLCKFVGISVDTEKLVKFLHYRLSGYYLLAVRIQSSSSVNAVKLLLYKSGDAHDINQHQLTIMPALCRLQIFNSCQLPVGLTEYWVKNGHMNSLFIADVVPIKSRND